MEFTEILQACLLTTLTGVLSWTVLKTQKHSETIATLTARVDAHDSFADLAETLRHTLHGLGKVVDTAVLKLELLLDGRLAPMAAPKTKPKQKPKAAPAAPAAKRARKK